MATTFKTPGVYIQEIDSFPPSINAVETAIPAFIGYTQKAADQNGPLVKIPRKISSMLEYQQFFGAGPNPVVDSVTLDSNNNFVSAQLEIPYKMYDSVSLFYANGGGDCYIVSAGLYPTSAHVDDFLTDYPAGGIGHPAILSPLSAIAKEDEPTLLVFPDNKLMGAQYKDVYTAALLQCATLQNRFLVCDVDVDPTSSDEPGSKFRDDIGIDHLSYAAAYIPWLNVVSPKTISYADFKDHVFIGSTQVSSLASLTTDPNIVSRVQDLDNLLTDIATIDAATVTVEGSSASVNDAYDGLKTALQTSGTPGTSLQAVFAFAYSIASSLNSFVTTGTGKLKSSMLTSVSNLISTGIGLHFADLFASLTPFDKLAGTNINHTATTTITMGVTDPTDVVTLSVTHGIYTGPLVDPAGFAGNATPATNALNLYNAINSYTGTSHFTATYPGTGAVVTIIAPADSGLSGDEDWTLTVTHTGGSPDVSTGSFTLGTTTWNKIPGYTALHDMPSYSTSPWSSGAFATPSLPTGLTYPALTATDAQRAAFIMANVDPVLSKILQLYVRIAQSAEVNEANAELALTNSFPVFKSIVNGLNNTPISMPPSGAIVGLYAAVDNDRGVWKAPANVSVNNVLGPDAVFNNGQLDELNVDVNAGKSINAIRPFKGKGTLVYGARTLAGNDNNWRYVNVRRFFIMVEQSVKKAIESFVFEPNDANTWNRTKAMVDAFLFQQWRAGALQGAKPEQAYFVKVGLGETMVAQDILEGRMIVSIGMAVVHPAEFIILEFSQVMPQS